MTLKTFFDQNIKSGPHADKLEQHFKHFYSLSNTARMFKKTNIISKSSVEIIFGHTESQHTSQEAAKIYCH